MKLVRCERKHYYDSDKHGFCPECLKADNRKISEAETIVPQGMQEEETVYTVAVDSYPENTVSMPFSAPVNAGNSYMTSGFNQVPPSVQPVVSQQPVYQTDGMMSSFAREMASSASTVHVNPSLRMPEPEAIQETDDECKTVSIYDDDIAPVTGWIVCVQGECQGESYKIRTGQNFIGRSPNMDICLSGENTVSRQYHAAIIFDPESSCFFLSPGQSGSLAYLNNQVLLKPEILNAYDEIRLGRAQFVFIPLCGPNFSWKKYIGQ